MCDFGSLDDDAAVRRLTVDADEIRSSYDVYRHRQRRNLCYFAANCRHLIRGSFNSKDSDTIKKYWAGEPLDESLIWEYLIDGVIELVNLADIQAFKDQVKKMVPNPSGLPN